MSANLAKLTEAVGRRCACDTTRAGVVVSMLGARSWYVSCARYPTGVSSKTIVCSAKGDTFEQAVTACMLAWLVLGGRTPALADELDISPGTLGLACRRAL